MDKLLAKVRALPDSLQKVLVFGVLASVIGAVVVLLQVLG